MENHHGIVLLLQWYDGKRRRWKRYIGTAGEVQVRHFLKAVERKRIQQRDWVVVQMSGDSEYRRIARLIIKQLDEMCEVRKGIVRRGGYVVVRQMPENIIVYKEEKKTVQHLQLLEGHQAREGRTINRRNRVIPHIAVSAALVSIM